MGLILGIESTCDETGVGIVQDGRILANAIASQLDLHRPFGGVVPELAARSHLERFAPTLQAALDEAQVPLNQVDLIAVAKGPGLLGSLLVGTQAAKGLAMALNKPILGVNHLEAHLIAATVGQPVRYPCLGMIVSGGHTSLVYVPEPHRYQLIGETLDDAIGEAYDKVARLLELPYPGGPNLEKLARSGDPHRFPFKPGLVKGRPLDFSYSGLKTSFLHQLRAQPELTEQTRADLAASFQEAAIQAVVSRVALAMQSYPAQGLLLGGGVTQNLYLRQQLQRQLGPNLWLPPPGLCADNGAMIALLAWHQQGQMQKEQLHCSPRLPIASSTALLT
jgi:N6-L-threonylcarbamoyladenine synthase